MNYSELPGIQCVILLLVSYLKNSFLQKNETNILYIEILMPDVIIKSLFKKVLDINLFTIKIKKTPQEYSF